MIHLQPSTLGRFPLLRFQSLAIILLPLVPAAQSFCHLIFFGKVHADVQAGIDDFEGCVHQAHQMQAAELARQRPQPIFLIGAVYIQPGLA